MKQGVYTVRDDVAEAFCLPWYSLNDNVAIRSFVAGCADSQSRLSTSPSDYALFKLGTFDDETGKIEVDIPKMLVRGSVPPKE